MIYCVVFLAVLWIEVTVVVFQSAVYLRIFNFLEKAGQQWLEQGSWVAASSQNLLTYAQLFKINLCHPSLDD